MIFSDQTVAKVPNSGKALRFKKEVNRIIKGDEIKAQTQGFFIYAGLVVSTPVPQLKVATMLDELSLDEGTYEMANLRERTTGLPFVVFVSQRGKAKHPCRVKVSKEPQTARFLASVSVNNPIEVKDGEIPAEELEPLKKWILLNQEALLQYWDGGIQYTEDLMEKLKPV